MNTYDFSVKTADGGTQNLRDYAGQLLLIVNVASKCGLTPQYEGLEQLYTDDQDAGLAIVGFPCNQFGGQEPGTDTEIQEFCSVNYGVSFPVFSKIDVNGPSADPLYAYLREQAPGDPDESPDGAIRWNFTKFLIGRDGEVIRRYEPQVTPGEIEADIAPLLSA